jgi:hypothetical protein
MEGGRRKGEESGREWREGGGRRGGRERRQRRVEVENK